MKYIVRLSHPQGFIPERSRKLDSLEEAEAWRDRFLARSDYEGYVAEIEKVSE